MAAKLRPLMHGEQGCPVWGTEFAQTESDGMATGGELSRFLKVQSTREQARRIPEDALEVDAPSLARSPITYATESMIQHSAIGGSTWTSPTNTPLTASRDLNQPVSESRSHMTGIPNMKRLSVAALTA